MKQRYIAIKQRPRIRYARNGFKKRCFATMLQFLVDWIRVFFGPLIENETISKHDPNLLVPLGKVKDDSEILRQYKPYKSSMWYDGCFFPIPLHKYNYKEFIPGKPGRIRTGSRVQSNMAKLTLSYRLEDSWRNFFKRTPYNFPKLRFCNMLQNDYTRFFALAFANMHNTRMLIWSDTFRKTKIWISYNVGSMHVKDFGLYARLVDFNEMFTTVLCPVQLFPDLLIQCILWNTVAKIQEDAYEMEASRYIYVVAMLKQKIVILDTFEKMRYIVPFYDIFENEFTKSAAKYVIDESMAALMPTYDY